MRQKQQKHPHAQVLDAAGAAAPRDPSADIPGAPVAGECGHAWHERLRRAFTDNTAAITASFSVWLRGGSSRAQNPSVTYGSHASFHPLRTAHRVPAPASALPGEAPGGPHCGLVLCSFFAMSYFLQPSQRKPSDGNVWRRGCSRASPPPKQTAQTTLKHRERQDKTEKGDSSKQKTQGF